MSWFLYVTIYALLSIVTSLTVYMFMIEYKTSKGFMLQAILAGLFWPLLWLYVLGMKLLYSK
jgi:hypothetical protein